MPTAPCWRSDRASPSATVDLPTPPLPAPTAMTRRNRALAEEGLPDLTLGRGRREHHHPIADLELRLVVGVHELAASNDPADEGSGRKAKARDGLSGGGRPDCDLCLDQLVRRSGERHERHEAA